MRRIDRRLPGGRRRARARFEVGQWRDWLTSRGEGDYRNQFEAMTDPAAPLTEPLILALLDQIHSDPLTILDVNAGPLTYIGKTLPSRSVEITPIDPLAHRYDHALAEAGIEPPVRTDTCAGEDLLQLFGLAPRFDIAYAGSLDHAKDPALVIENMSVVATFVVLRLLRTEADAGSPDNAQQWTFDATPQGLLIQGRYRKLIPCTCWLEGDGRNQVLAVLEPRRAGTEAHAFAPPSAA